MSKKLTNEEFIIRAKKIYGDKYDYSKTKYKKINDEIIIICPIHKEFLVRASDHIYIHKGCSKCLKKEKTIKFIKKSIKIHGDKYDYSKVNYERPTEKIKIFCKKHKGFIYQLPYNHLHGGCKKCAIINLAQKKRLTIKEFIKKARKIHGDKYDYSKTKYVNSRNDVIIICKIHGSFQQRGNRHLRGCGCPGCKHKNQGDVGNLLLKYFKNWDISRNRKIWDNYKSCSHKRYCDFWLEKNDVKIIVEYDGQQHFKLISFGCKDKKKVEKKFKHTQLKDRLDAEFCKENNIILHRIKYDEDKEQLIKNLLKKVS